MRLTATILCLALAACTSAPSVPSDSIFYEVPPPAPQPSTRDDFTGRIEAALATPTPQGGQAGLVEPLPPLPGEAPPASVVPAPATSIAAASAVAAASGAAVPPGVAPTPLDDDRLNLNLYTLEQQRIDAAIAERELAEARSQLVIVQPGAVPRPVEGVNIALFAQQTTNPVGTRVYARNAVFGGAGGNCRRFSSPDQAQRAFLSSGGPQRDPYNLDPDGDGFACGWDPEPFRRLAR